MRPNSNHSAILMNRDEIKPINERIQMNVLIESKLKTKNEKYAWFVQLLQLSYKKLFRSEKIKFDWTKLHEKVLSELKNGISNYIKIATRNNNASFILKNDTLVSVVGIQAIEPRNECWSFCSNL